MHSVATSMLVARSCSAREVVRPRKSPVAAQKCSARGRRTSRAKVTTCVISTGTRRSNSSPPPPVAAQGRAQQPVRLVARNVKVDRRVQDGPLDAVYRGVVTSDDGRTQMQVLLKTGKATADGAAQSHAREARVAREASARAPGATAAFVGELVVSPSEEQGLLSAGSWLVYEYEGAESLSALLQGMAQSNLPGGPLLDAVMGPAGAAELRVSEDAVAARAAAARGASRLVLSALRSLHASGLVHRDLRPESVALVQQPPRRPASDPPAASARLVHLAYATEMAPKGTSGCGPLGPALLQTRRSAYHAPELTATYEVAELRQIAGLESASGCGLEDAAPAADRCDVFAAGLLFLQMAVPALANDFELRRFRDELGASNYDLAVWRLGYGQAWAPQQTAVLDLHGGEGWDLARRMLLAEPTERLSAAEALAHPFLRSPGDEADARGAAAMASASGQPAAQGQGQPGADGDAGAERSRGSGRKQVKRIISGSLAAVGRLVWGKDGGKGKPAASGAAVVEAPPKPDVHPPTPPELSRAASGASASAAAPAASRPRRGETPALDAESQLAQMTALLLFLNSTSSTSSAAAAAASAPPASSADPDVISALQEKLRDMRLKAYQAATMAKDARDENAQLKAQLEEMVHLHSVAQMVERDNNALAMDYQALAEALRATQGAQDMLQQELVQASTRAQKAEVEARELRAEIERLKASAAAPPSAPAAPQQQQRDAQKKKGGVFG